MEILKCEGRKKMYGSGASQAKALDGTGLAAEKGGSAAGIGASSVMKAGGDEYVERLFSKLCKK